MACKDCLLYDVEKVKDKAGRIRKDWVARCFWESSEVWPISVEWMWMSQRPRGSYVRPYDGAMCPCFVERKDDANP